ncbi:MAG TPA: enoyl-CoA hydratase/isomerase family protein, partial [Pseudomonadales bacterium]|nr:enoyl-CoA hydratase/isomerase family protein [Pseudomonadales bacterium]
MAEIEFENRDGVGLITFARPDRLNVVSWSMLTELGELYRRCDTDAAVRVVVITGRGSAFCAGADLSRADAFAAAAGGDFSSCPLS